MSLLVIVLMQTVVRTAEGLFVLGEIVREGMTGWAGPVAPVEEWERMYRRPDVTIRMFAISVECPESSQHPAEPPECLGMGTAFRLSRTAIRQLQREDPETLNRDLREWLKTPEALQVLQTARNMAREGYEEALSTSITWGFDDDVLDDNLQQIEGQFFLLVWLPCWLEYGDSASRLLQRAETGDLVAVEQLLRLDKQSLFFPRIRRIFEEAN